MCTCCCYFNDYHNCICYAGDETFVLPSGITEIEPEAFEGCSSFSEVTIPDGTITLGDGAFRNCSYLSKVTLPSSLESVGDSAFDGCGETLYIISPKESTASQWAQANGYDWNSETVYRALVIAQNYTGTDYVLLGLVNDMHSQLLSANGILN